MRFSTLHVRRWHPSRRRTRKKSNPRRTKLGLPDLEHAKSAVLVSLRSPESQRSYRRSIDDFVSWYCSEPRLSFNKTVVTRYRIHLEDQSLAPGTINVRLEAVRRLAYEAADTGLLSPELAAGIRRVKGAKKLGMRLGNWLTVDEARSLWQLPNVHSAKGKRDRAILAVLLGCDVVAIQGEGLVGDGRINSERGDSRDVRFTCLLGASTVGE